MAYEPTESITEISPVKRKAAPAPALFFHPVEAEPFTGTKLSLRAEDFLRLVHESGATVFQRIQRNFHLMREESNEAHKVVQKILQIKREHHQLMEHRTVRQL